MTEQRTNMFDKTRTSNKKTFEKEMQKKLAITVLVIMLALIALIYRLYKIQDEYSEEYNQKILSQQRYDSRGIPAKRGDITDRNGLYLATSTKVYNLILDPSQINSNQENYLEPTVGLLRDAFGMNTDELKSIIAEKSDSQYVRYQKELSYDEMMHFEELKTEKNNAYKENSDPHRVYGVWFEDSYSRYYPNNTLASSVIGFSYSDGGEGSGGIEQYYNDDLVGTNGREYGYLNEDSNLERVIKPAKDGNTIVTTIDSNIQSIVEKYIAEWEADTGSKTTACIVMDPNNGEILAMADSRPYNLNNPRDLSAYYSEGELATMTDAQKADIWNSIWRNYCISDTYEPGSVSKIFTVAGALEEGVIDGSEVYVCDGFQDIGGWIIKCNNHAGHGALNITQSLMQSCNDVMMQVSEAEGKEKFMKFMNIFGFGKKTGIDLPGEADTSALIHRASDMVPSDLATNSFGQNFNCSMIQMASAYCSVINGGSYYEPHVVRRILDSQGNVVKNVEPKIVCETVSSGTSKFINTALLHTVNEGTGGAAIISGYEIAGKTGTGEKYPRGEQNYLVSFAGYAPADNPEVFCYVIVDEPHVEDQAHAKFATDIFRKIMKDILPYMNVYRQGDYVDDTQEETVSYALPETSSAPDTETETKASETHSSEKQPETTKHETEAAALETTAVPPVMRDEYVEHQTNTGDEGNQETSEETLPGIPAGYEISTVEPLE